jgi:serine/threonine protein kinase
MKHETRWQQIRKIGQGGQGPVFEVFDKTKFDIEHNLLQGLKNSLGGLTTAQQSYHPYFNQFRTILDSLLELRDPRNHGALKLLSLPDEARDPKLSLARIKKEIEAMQRCSHANLLPLLDSDPDSGWFVGQYYHQGSLSENRSLYTGDIFKTLRDIRPLVAGVATLHAQGIVHRDIKPHNIFLDSSGDLILGDFGLAFCVFDEHTRVSDTYENVGSRDWMPPWAMGIRIEDIKPSFDVFSLGKLIWSMISTTPILQLWYFDEDSFDLRTMFPHIPEMAMLNQFFARCIVQYEPNCLRDASELLEELDGMMRLLKLSTDLEYNRINPRCRLCGLGKYSEMIDRNITDLHNFGLQPAGTRTFKIFKCDRCGNVQVFAFGDRKDPPLWSA